MNTGFSRDGQTTTANVSIEAIGEFPALTGTGTARCRREDAFSKTTGEMIAAGRAIQHLGQQITELGEARVVTNDELDRALVLIDEIADELGTTEMEVGSVRRAADEEAQAAEEDELVNKFIEMLIGKQFGTDAAVGGCDDPNCGCL